MRRWCWFLGYAVLVLSPLSAATVSVLVVESGLPGGAKSPESSFLWETGIMDVFFDAGHIVCNAPIVRMDETPKEKLPPEVRSELYDARDGGADYFVIALLEYRNGLEKPAAVYLRVFSVTDGALLYESTNGWNATRKGAREELNEVKQTARKLVPELNRAGS